MVFLVSLSLVVSILALILSIHSFSSMRVERNTCLISELIQQISELKSEVNVHQKKLMLFEDDGR